MDEALDMDAAKEAVLRLGLKADNTAADRANDPRMFPQPVYHGTSYDINKLKDPKLQLFESFYTITDPSSASEYALSSALRRGFPKGTGSNKDDKDNPSKDTPALAKANKGIIMNATYGLIECSSLINKE